MTDPVIVVNGITKHFPRNPQLMRRRENMAIYLSRRFLRKENRPFIALENINLKIYQGEAVGLVGSNGAGKSTLLRVITGITSPTSGKVTIKGHYRELFALNGGFNMEISGRKNIYLYAAMKKVPQKELEKKIDKIIEFAGLEEFIDDPVKNYSSGMRGRLGFSIITHTIPDILFIDEALSTGDEAFKQKCDDTLLRLKREGKTLVMVSHELDILKALCTRVIWLEKGKIKMDGSVAEVLDAYHDFQAMRMKSEDAVNADKSLV